MIGGFETAPVSGNTSKKPTYNIGRGVGPSRFFVSASLLASTPWKAVQLDTFLEHDCASDPQDVMDDKKAQRVSPAM